eukprot:TRINITY_DN2520_c0_g1_i1.p1 TRINITY_DN2520_c0_g1~~TRINITY_DN2520_c0_g1_i1.p1  ORF type:complete len:726 (-),score=178.98 TRINITY_DN2520_c0_g1_i1:128-2305(-)
MRFLVQPLINSAAPMLLTYNRLVKTLPTLSSCIVTAAQRPYSTKKNAQHDKIEPRLFDKILIANRGEIACRVIRTARKMGIKTVAVFSEADAESLHVSMADEAHFLATPTGSTLPTQSYLRGDEILRIARATGAQGIHPGYGFLSENAGFASMCEKSGVVFIGPPASAIAAMGSKSESKKIMVDANVPVVPGYHGDNQDVGFLKEQAAKIQYPVLIKAIMGGGGKGMKIVYSPDEFEEQLNSAKREAKNSFGDERVLIEKYLTKPRHIEFQVFADRYGEAAYLFERDCSVQRRHQKVLEEAPAPGMTPDLRAAMGQSAVAAAKAVGYVGAGTVEFIFQDGTYYFMEMNTRLQVEHPVTEMITGQDLVEWQLKVASGYPLPKKQSELEIKGHSLEARIYAENPAKGFLPSTGVLEHLRPPKESENLRVETGVKQGDAITIYYDPMIAKLVVWDRDRRSALRRMHAALCDYHIVGLQTNIEFLDTVVQNPVFASGDVDTGFIQKNHGDLFPPAKPASADTLASAAMYIVLNDLQKEKTETARTFDPKSPWSMGSSVRFNLPNTRNIELVDGEATVKVSVTQKGDTYKIELPDGKTLTARGTLGQDGELSVNLGDKTMTSHIVQKGNKLHLFTQDGCRRLELPQKVRAKASAVGGAGSLMSPMPGRIVRVLVNAKDTIKKGAPLLVMEAMKMEYTVRAPADGVVEKVLYNTGDMVEEQKLLVQFQAQQ